MILVIGRLVPGCQSSLSLNLYHDQSLEDTSLISIVNCSVLSPFHAGLNSVHFPIKMSREGPRSRNPESGIRKCSCQFSSDYNLFSENHAYETLSHGQMDTALRSAAVHHASPEFALKDKHPRTRNSCGKWVTLKIS